MGRHRINPGGNHVDLFGTEPRLARGGLELRPHTNHARYHQSLHTTCLGVAPLGAKTEPRPSQKQLGHMWLHSAWSFIKHCLSMAIFQIRGRFRAFSSQSRRRFASFLPQIRGRFGAFSPKSRRRLPTKGIPPDLTASGAGGGWSGVRSGKIGNLRIRLHETQRNLEKGVPPTPCRLRRDKDWYAMIGANERGW